MQTPRELRCASLFCPRRPGLRQGALQTLVGDEWDLASPCYHPSALQASLLRPRAPLAPGAARHSRLVLLHNNSHTTTHHNPQQPTTSAHSATHIHSTKRSHTHTPNSITLSKLYQNAHGCLLHAARCLMLLPGVAAGNVLFYRSMCVRRWSHAPAFVCFRMAAPSAAGLNWGRFWACAADAARFCAGQRIRSSAAGATRRWRCSISPRGGCSRLCSNSIPPWASSKRLRCAPMASWWHRHASAARTCLRWMGPTWSRWRTGPAARPQP